MSNISENFKVKNGLTVNTTISAGSCVEADSFKKHDGTSSQFLKADGSVDSNTYTTCTGKLNSSGVISINDFAQFDTFGCLIGRNCSETRSDLGINTAANCTASSLNQSSCPGIDCVGTITGFEPYGDGITIDTDDPAGILVEVDSSVVRTSGPQTITGVKTFSNAINGVTIDTTGDITAQGCVYSYNDVYLGSYLDVGGNACVCGNITVDGTSCLKDDVTVVGDLSSTGATYTDCLVVGGSTLDGTNGATFNGDFVVQNTGGQDYLKVSAGNVCFNTGGGTTQMGSANLGARVNIQAISDAVPTLAVRGKSGSSDLVRVSSPSVTCGDYFNINNDGKIGIGQAFPTAKMEIVNNSTTVDTLLLKTTDNSSDAAPIQTFKRESDSPSSGDYLGQLKFKGLNNSCQEVVYSKITGKINDEQGGTEGGLFETAVQKSGTMTIVARQTDTDLKLINGTGLEVDGQILSAGNNLNSLFSNCTGNLCGVTSQCIFDSSCNFCIGACAGEDLTTGVSNTLIGKCAGRCITTGQHNISIGSRAGEKNCTKHYNISLGYQAGYCGSGCGNFAVGQSAMQNSTASNAVAIGKCALVSTSGNSNVAIGSQALQCTTTGSGNFGLGAIAGYANQSGCDNVFIGSNAHRYSISGNSNIAIGKYAGRCHSSGTKTGGSNSVFIGTDARASGACPSNEIVIGCGAIGCGSNTAMIGNSSISVVCSNGTFSTVSDCRDKTCICDIELGIDFISNLQPKTFNMITDRNDPEGSISCKRHGFIAQDVLALEGSDPVIISNDNPDRLGYTGEHIIPILVKAVQELEARVKELEG